MSLAINISAVACAGRAVLIEGDPGSGKSSLALALIDRGAVLIGDDGVVLEARGSRLIASVPPRAAGLIEVRNVGLIETPIAAAAKVCLVLRLDPEAPRFIERADTAVYEGIAIPLVRLCPDSPVLALRAEAALRQWGLPA